ncbi:DUF3541 domain-containing protein [Vibrio gangliei]|uniref:DUF3541 domain-containing protein n=1 Tax=Vibrio gangliei TaxID=2077090 RepID=UPI000D016750|nr:DUF3541 domain-containing protein [Vibrio gangliei]
MLKRKPLTLALVILLGLSQFAVVPTSLAEAPQSSSSVNLKTTRYQQDAERIKQTFEAQLYTLNADTAGHYGLRMYRQTLDPKYSAAVWSDMARVVSTLNQIAANIQTPKQAKAYGEKKLKAYANSNKTRTKMRYDVTKSRPEYLFLGIDLLSTMARADEYGLKHKYDKHLHNLIRQFDFKPYATDPDMIKAWAAQLANQVYWLRQLGEQDVVDDFITAFQKTYPDSQDKQLSDQQYANKIYGLTHIIFAASEYYKKPIDAKEFAWIYDYFDKNIEQILTRTKDDVIAEVGISYLLAEKYHSSTLADAQATIAHSIDHDMNMIPSTDGDFELSKGEHRNVLAIMLLNWQGTNEAPTITAQPDVFKNLPYGLVKK